MQPELIIFLLMVGSFMLSCFAFKLSAGIGMVIAAIVARWLEEWAFLSRSLSKERLRSWTRSLS